MLTNDVADDEVGETRRRRSAGYWDACDDGAITNAARVCAGRAGRMQNRVASAGVVERTEFVQAPVSSVRFARESPRERF